MGRKLREDRRPRRILERLGLGRPAKRVWDLPNVEVLFHYTEPGFAEAIFEEGEYLVSERPHQQHGHGFFATNIQPSEMPDDRLLTVVFANQRPSIVVQGVVVLLHVPDFRSLGGRHFHWPAPAGTILPLDDVALGFGRRTSKGAWMFSAELYTPA